MKPSESSNQIGNKSDHAMPSRKSSDNNPQVKGTLHKPAANLRKGEPQSPGSKPEKLSPGAMTLKIQQARQGLVSNPRQDVIEGEWSQRVGAAKVAWGKLTNDELLQSRGEVQKLSGLLQKRYGISAVHAERKVKQFFDNE